MKKHVLSCFESWNHRNKDYSHQQESKHKSRMNRLIKECDTGTIESYL